MSKYRPEETDLRNIIEELIAIYNNPFGESVLRQWAAETTGELTRRYSSLILDLVIEDAQRYASRQHIDDADSSHPNSFDVLAMMENGSEKVITFLRNVIRDDWGPPRWEAIKVLCQFNDPTAEQIIVDLIRGAYPPKCLDIQYDLYLIEQTKGRNFLENRH